MMDRIVADLDVAEANVILRGLDKQVEVLKGLVKKNEESGALVAAQEVRDMIAQIEGDGGERPGLRHQFMPWNDAPPPDQEEAFLTASGPWYVQLSPSGATRLVNTSTNEILMGQSLDQARGCANDLNQGIIDAKASDDRDWKGGGK